MSDVKLVEQVIPLWFAYRRWAEELLVAAFGLVKAEDILVSHRGLNAIAGTNFFVRTHGVGVEVSKAPGVGGIDFDFDKPQPDVWRLQIFIEAQAADGNLPLQQFDPLLRDEDRLRAAVAGALSRAAT